MIVDDIQEVLTIDERLERLKKEAKGHFGEIRFVGLKLHDKIGWVAEIQFDEFESLIAEGETAIDAIKNLRQRVLKIINRYNAV